MITILKAGLVVLGAMACVLVLALLAGVRRMRTLRNLSLIALAVMGCGILLAAGVFVFGAGVPLLPVRVASHIEMARSRIHIGDGRDQAVQALSDAWYHADCRFPDGSGEELFFYGPQNLRDVGIVLINSQLVDGKVSVSFVGGLEPELLHLYNRCVPTRIINDLDPQS